MDFAIFSHCHFTVYASALLLLAGLHASFAIARVTLVD